MPLGRTRLTARPSRPPARRRHWRGHRWHEPGGARTSADRAPRSPGGSSNPSGGKRLVPSGDAGDELRCCRRSGASARTTDVTARRKSHRAFGPRLTSRRCSVPGRSAGRDVRAVETQRHRCCQAGLPAYVAVVVRQLELDCRRLVDDDGRRGAAAAPARGNVQQRAFDGSRRCRLRAPDDEHDMAGSTDGSEALRRRDVAPRPAARRTVHCRRVAAVNVLMRVRDANDDPGSLNPMCRPMPSSCTSTPPRSARSCSYCWPRRLEIVGPHVGPEQPVGFEVDMAGEPLADECPVRLRVIGREADVLVEQHRAGSREGPARRPDGPRPAAYVGSGELPVARPITASGRSFSTRTITSATSRPASSADGVMTTSKPRTPGRLTADDRRRHVE